MHPIPRAQIAAGIAAFFAGATVGALAELAKALSDARRERLQANARHGRELDELEEEILADADEKTVQALARASLVADVERIQAGRELRTEVAALVVEQRGPFDGVPQAAGGTCKRTGACLCFDRLELWAAEGTGAGLTQCSCENAAAVTAFGLLPAGDEPEDEA